MKKRVLRRAVSGILLLFLSASVASAATYYVRTDGNNGNAGTTNATAGSWLTINYAAGHIAAGDTVRVEPGTYVETAAPSVNGTFGNTVTLVADGAVTTCGMSFASKSYIRVIGFTMNPNASSCGGRPSPIVNMTGTNTGLEFWNNDVGNQSGMGIAANSAVNLCNKCIIVGGTVHNISNANNGITLVGDDTFVGYVNLATICYIGVNPSGSRGRFLNLNFSGFQQCNATHPDFFYINVSSRGFSDNLVESNFGIGTTTSTDNKYFHAENQSTVAWTDDVWRFNVAYDTGAAAGFSMYSDTGGNTLTNWRFYNNTTTYGDRALSGSQYNNCGNISNNGGGAITYYVYNTIFYQCWADNATSGIVPWATTNPSARDYNLGFSPLGSVTWGSNWTTQSHPQTNIDPKLNNVSGLDFTLQSASGARAVGGPLTTASGSGSNSTTLTVAANTGGFFIGSNASNLPQYGGNLVPGDFITVGSTTAQVASVSGDTLTLASPISWSSGAPLYFGGSSTIDMGAYPYKSGGYALSANATISGGTATIMPNDASLVRFVVCYSDNVPYAVANSSPYTCAAPSGTFSARVYPRYASQTQWVTAGSSSGQSAPAAPTNPRIIP